jgi:hypothetical protein
MLILSLYWLLLGALIGALAIGASHDKSGRYRPPSWQFLGWLWMLAIGALAALLGGWLGALLLGKYIATAMALWVAVLAMVGTWLVAWVRTRFIW